MHQNNVILSSFAKTKAKRIHMVIHFFVFYYHENFTLITQLFLLVNLSADRPKFVVERKMWRMYEL